MKPINHQAAREVFQRVADNIANTSRREAP